MSIWYILPKKFRNQIYGVECGKWVKPWSSLLWIHQAQFESFVHLRYFQESNILSGIGKKFHLRIALLIRRCNLMSNLYFLISWFAPPCDISLSWLYFPELRHLIGSSRTSCKFQTRGNSWHKKYRKRYSFGDIDKIDWNKFKMDFNIEETFEVFIAVAILTVAIIMVISASLLNYLHHHIK